MLAGRDQADAKPLRLAEPEHDGGHLDRLRAGPDHAGDDPARSPCVAHESVGPLGCHRPVVASMAHDAISGNRSSSFGSGHRGGFLRGERPVRVFSFGLG